MAPLRALAPAPAAWHTLPPAEVASRLGTDPDRGLEPDEAKRRLQEHGPNALAEEKGRSWLRMLADQFANVLVGLLVAAAALSAVLGHATDAAAIVAIVVLNGVVGFLQERHAAHALAALRRLSAPQAKVKRSGEVQVVAASDVVPGDVVVMEAGDRVPADLRLVAASSLSMTEASLTGESEPVEKEPMESVDAGAPLGDRRTMAWMSTTVANGSAEGIVVATGAGTEIGRIAALVSGTDEGETPLQERLRKFGKVLVLLSCGVVALVFGLGILRGIPFVEMLLTSVSLAVAAVPEGLPAVVTIALAFGVRKLARRNALVRKLASVETLGSTSVICSDKTGTLTTGTMEVKRLWTPAGETTVEGRRLELSGDDPARALLHAAVAASTARPAQRDGRTEIAGDPTEAALLRAAALAGIDAAGLDGAEPVESEQPFDSKRKRMSIVRRTRDGAVSYVKGAVEAVLPACRGADAAAVTARGEELAGEGMRVLAVARKSMKDGGPPEEGLTLLGLVAMHDPPRAEAKAAVDACRKAGIRVVMITGDHPRTGFAIARALGIAKDPSEVMSGPDVESEGDLRSRVEKVSVYARVSPEHKLRIVRAWQARGEVVAMTGDGVNDAPALKAADIGVAMGKTGTDVAKEAAEIVVTDDNFTSIVAAVEEGRRIFENIRKTLLYLLTGNIAEIAVMTIAIVAGMPLPLVAIQLLWINLVTDGLPALALAVDPADPDVLKRPPLRAGTEIADRNFLAWMAWGGALAAACTLGAFAYGLYVQGSLEKARTYAFSALVIEEVLRAFAYRSRTRTLWEIGPFSNRALVAVAVAIIGLQVFSHHSPILERFLHTGELSWLECLAIVGVGFIPVSLLETWKLLRRARR